MHLWVGPTSKPQCANAQSATATPSSPKRKTQENCKASREYSRVYEGFQPSCFHRGRGPPIPVMRAKQKGVMRQRGPRITRTGLHLLNHNVTLPYYLVRYFTAHTVIRGCGAYQNPPLWDFAQSLDYEKLADPCGERCGRRRLAPT